MEEEENRQEEELQQMKEEGRGKREGTERGGEERVCSQKKTEDMHTNNVPVKGNGSGFLATCALPDIPQIDPKATSNHARSN